MTLALLIHRLLHSSNSKPIPFIINFPMLLPSISVSKIRSIASPGISIFDQSATRKLCRHENAMRGTLLRHIHTTPRFLSSGSLFNLSGLSTSRESGFLSRERGIPRTEFSPHLELIRLSEVEPFAAKKLPTDSLHSSPVSSHKLLQQSDDNDMSVAYLIKELERTKLAKEEAERSNRELRHKTKIVEEKLDKLWENLAALSIIAVIATILGLHYRRKLYDFILQSSPNFRGLQIASHHSSDAVEVEQSMEIPATPPEKASPPKPDQDVDHVSFWRRMFWAY